MLLKIILKTKFTDFENTLMKYYLELIEDKDITDLDTLIGEMFNCDAAEIEVYFSHYDELIAGHDKEILETFSRTDAAKDLCGKITAHQTINRMLRTIVWIAIEEASKSIALKLRNTEREIDYIIERKERVKNEK